jgi:hypothetical protein
MGDGGGGSGELAVRGAAGDHDHAEAGGGHLGLGQAGLGGAEGEIGDRFVGGGEAALVDATHVFDPFCVTADVGADFGVGNDAFRKIGGEFAEEGQ